MREEGDRGDQEEKRGIKRRVIDLGSTLFPKCYPQPGTHTEITELGREEKGEGGDRGDWGRKGRVKRGERNQANNHTSM